MDSVLNHITIRELLKNKFRYATAFSDKLIITDHLGYLELSGFGPTEFRKKI